MSFDIQTWLRGQIGDNSLECPLIDISKREPGDDREWLETNGLGSYASAGIWGANTRRYHGLLVASLNPPVQRTVMLSRIDEVVAGESGSQSLATNHWQSGVVAPDGYKHVSAFTTAPSPTWVFELADGVLVKQVAFIPGTNRVAIGYTWLAANGGKGKSIKLSLSIIGTNRDFHGETHGWNDWRFAQKVDGNSVNVKAWADAPAYTLTFDRGTYTTDGAWYWGYHWPREAERGLNESEDLQHLGTLTVALEAGQSVTIVAEAGEKANFVSIADAVKASWAHKQELLKKAGNPKDAVLKQLVLAADQFVVHRNSTDGNSIIAGYHWFGDWGRDSMISLSGLTLSSGRPEAAKSILETFGKYLSEGMLPNFFPDGGQKPEYNTSDATFWWAWALYKYFEKTGDLSFVRKQLPLLESVVEWHKKGTRHRLRLDSQDGLIAGGEPGVQLTWMDAKCGDYVVTPRQGKAVEINALWYNFLMTLDFFEGKVREADATTAGASPRQALEDYAGMAAKAKAGLAKFWNAERGCLVDVIRDDGSKDESIRPNQLFAISLPYVAFSEDQARSILAVVEAELLTPKGLRTLSPHDPAYQGKYGLGKAKANQYDRDITYHQGTVWPWLFGCWVNARVFAHGATKENFAHIGNYLAAIKAHIFAEAGVGSISEICDGDAPHTPRGCVAQAWSVAELLRVMTEYPGIC
jgi:predicted glycogen debranching enzyme